MRITMEYELPSEREEYSDAMNGHIYRSILRGLIDYLRAQYKYSDRDSFTYEEILDEVNKLNVDSLDL